jgi:hypothetical protein
MHKNYRIKSWFDVNHDDPNPNPKVYYKAQRKVWWWWEDIHPFWPPNNSYEGALQEYYRFVSHETKVVYHDI